MGSKEFVDTQCCLHAPTLKTTGEPLSGVTVALGHAGVAREPDALL